jgi:hypothetical protein
LVSLPEGRKQVMKLRFGPSRENDQEGGDNYIMRSFIILKFYRMLLGLFIAGYSDWQHM